MKEQTEQKFKVGEQWYYRGNQSERWFFLAGRGKDAPPSGIAEMVPPDWWPFLEEIAQLRAPFVSDTKPEMLLIRKALEQARAKFEDGNGTPEWLEPDFDKEIALLDEALTALPSVSDIPGGGKDLGITEAS